MNIPTAALHPYSRVSAADWSRKFRAMSLTELRDTHTALCRRRDSLPSAGHVSQANFVAAMIRDEIATR